MEGEGEGGREGGREKYIGGNSCFKFTFDVRLYSQWRRYNTDISAGKARPHHRTSLFADRCS